MIQALFDALKKQLPARVTLGLGPDELNRLEVPPRMVLVPSVDRFEPYNPNSKKAEDVGVSTPTATEARNVKPPYSRAAGFTLHILGKDYDQTEALLEAAVAGLRKIAGTSLTLNPSGWNDDAETEGAALDSSKRKYLLSFGIYLETGANDPETTVRLERTLLESTDILNPTE